MAVKRVVFLDKDGTLIEDLPYNIDHARIVLAPGAVEALHVLADHGFRFIVVSNQPGVALGRFPRGALDAVANHLADLFLANDLELDGCYWCPHHPEGALEDFAYRCTCRKPTPGLLQIAAAEHGIDLGRSWLIGDILDDVEAGNAAGCRTVMLDIGNETEWRRSPARTPDFYAGDLLSAARGILRAERPQRRRRAQPGRPAP